LSVFQTRTTKSIGRTTQQQLSTINKDDLTILTGEPESYNVTPTHIKKKALDRSKLGDLQLSSFATIQPSTVLFTPTYRKD
jgi:hypothetical protein